MRVTELLNTEHGVYLTQLGVLEGMLKSQSPAGELRAVTLAIAQTVEMHRVAEEKILYPAILREFGERFAPIQVMMAEHKEIEGFVRGVGSGEGKLLELVQGFIDVLRQHIDKEIRVLFPMVEQRIAATDLERMARECVEHYHQRSGVTP